VSGCCVRASRSTLVTAVSITPKGAESPGRRRIGVIGALVLILSSETVSVGRGWKDKRTNFPSRPGSALRH